MFVPLHVDVNQKPDQNTVDYSFYINTVIVLILITTSTLTISDKE